MSDDWLVYVRSLGALALVIGLVLAAGWGARRFNLTGVGSGGRKVRRLAVSEVIALDSRRRLVLVRRDDTEHLLLVGGTTDLVVETAIAAPRPVPVPPEPAR